MKRAVSRATWLCVVSLFGASQRPAVGWKAGEIWLMREGAPPLQLTDDGCEKGRTPVWAPDGSKVAYFTNRTVDKPECPTEVVLLSRNGVRLKAIPALDQGNSVQRIEWLGNDRIGIDTHMNPSAGQYRVMDVKTGKELASYFGSGFHPSPDSRLIAHAGWVPHFSPPYARSDYLVIDNAVAYPPNAGKEPNVRSPEPADQLLHRGIHEFRSGFVWAPDGAHIAFIDKTFDWRADKLGAYYGKEENDRWWLVTVSSAGGVPVQISIQEPSEAAIKLVWIAADRVKVECGSLTSEYTVVR